MDLKDIINGTCRKAINDERGNNILETYQKKLGIGEFIGNIDLISKNSVCLCWSIKCEGTFPLDNMVCILKTENYEEAGDTQAFVFQTALPVDGENEGRCFIRKKDLVGDEVSASDWHEIPSDATINKFEINFDSEDDENPVAWTSMRKIVSGKIKDLFGNVSIMAKNIRWLYKMLGTTDIASIGGGTLTGAVSKLNTDLQGKIFLTPMFMANEDGYLDCNDLPIGACAYAYPDTKNSPSRETGWKIFCYGAVWDYVAQIAVSYKGDKLAFRASWMENGAAIWGGWTILGK